MNFFCRTGFFILTPDYGLGFIADCRETGFHPHPMEPPLYTVNIVVLITSLKTKLLIIINIFYIFFMYQYIFFELLHNDDDNNNNPIMVIIFVCIALQFLFLECKTLQIGYNCIHRNRGFAKKMIHSGCGIIILQKKFYNFICIFYLYYISIII